MGDTDTILSPEDHEHFLTQGYVVVRNAVEAEVIEQLRTVDEQTWAFQDVARAIAAEDWPKALALLESEAGVAAARETGENGRRLLHMAAQQKDVPLAVLRKLVEADPAALAAKRYGRETPRDLARKSKAAPYSFLLIIL